MFRIKRIIQIKMNTCYYLKSTYKKQREKTRERERRKNEKKNQMSFNGLNVNCIEQQISMSQKLISVSGVCVEWDFVEMVIMKEKES